MKKNQPPRQPNPGNPNSGSGQALPPSPQRIPADPAKPSRVSAPQPQRPASQNKQPMLDPRLGYAAPAQSGTAMGSPSAGKKKKRKLHWYDWLIFAIILLLVGFGLYLLIKPRIVAKHQKTIASQLYALAPIDRPLGADQQAGMFVDPEANKVAGEDWEAFAPGKEKYEKGEKVWIQPIGQLQIDSIDLSLPLLNKSGLIELRYGIGHYPDSAPLYGDKGISVLFGHHMIERGHYFNRLDELKEGDSVRINGNGKEYFYTVDKKIVVNPEEMLPLLKQHTDDKYLLMITCTNPPAFEKRVLVYAKLTSTQDKNK